LIQNRTTLGGSTVVDAKRYSTVGNEALPRRSKVSQFEKNRKSHIENQTLKIKTGSTEAIESVSERSLEGS